VEFASSREVGEEGEAAAEVKVESVVMMAGVVVAMDAPGLAADVGAAEAVPEADPATPAAPSVPAAGVEVEL
jgi:hypothetical protein